MYHRVAALHEHRGRLLRSVLCQGEKGSQSPKGKGVRRHIHMPGYQSRSYRISERSDNRRIPCRSPPVYLSEDIVQQSFRTTALTSSEPTGSWKNFISYYNPTTTKRKYRPSSPTGRYNGHLTVRIHHILAVYGKPRWNRLNGILFASLARNSWSSNISILWLLRSKRCWIPVHLLPSPQILMISRSSLPDIFW